MTQSKLLPLIAICCATIAAQTLHAQDGKLLPAKPNEVTQDNEKVGANQLSQSSPVTPESKKSSPVTRESSPVTREEKLLERITVVGAGKNIQDLPGSAAIIQGEALEEAKTGMADVGRALRVVPGVNVVEEDGYGLRPNIGMRGTSSERSASVTLMEDGILIAPAPYAAPAAYFFPTFGRMSGMEVTKGVGQIKYGPRTTGGALNLLSTEIPDELKIKGDFSTGGNNTRRAHLYVGESYQNFGYLVETFQMATTGFKDLDGGGDTGFDLQDYVAKVRFNSDANADVYQQLQLKAGYYEQDADETYLGLTREDFGKTPMRRYAASQNDKVNITQQQYSARHYIELSEKADVTTTAYYNGTDRRWNKLDSVNGNSLSAVLDTPQLYQDSYAFLTGSQNSLADALVMRDAERDYFGRGVQSVAVARTDVVGAEHRFELGVRFHQDEEDRKQADNGYQITNGRMIQTSQNAPLGQTNRISSAEAVAVYLQDTVAVDKFRFMPGIRYENISLRRRDFGKSDPLRSGDSLKENESELNVFVPGVGLDYSWTDAFSSFAGVHKGFSPPGPSDKQGVKEEESIAYETGVNFKRNSLVSQVALFFSDYENILGQDSLASGGTGTGDQFNLGSAFTYGVESSVRYDLGELFATAWSLPVYGTYTYTDAEFRSTFASEQYGLVQNGDAIPYIAAHQFAVGAGVEHQRYGKYLLRSYFVDAMPTQPNSNGNAPETDPYFVVDAHLESPEIAKGVRLFGDVSNLFNSEYIVAARPAGARPGMPFTALAGIKVDL
jgi:Fe(3+) dicitrate transport protein